MEIEKVMIDASLYIKREFCKIIRQSWRVVVDTLKTGIPIEEGDSILQFLWRVSRPEIQLGVSFYSELDCLCFTDLTRHFLCNPIKVESNG